MFKSREVLWTLDLVPTFEYFTKVYLSPSSSLFPRSAMELLLLHFCKVDAGGQSIDL
jgi:hypothetical protein